MIKWNIVISVWCAAWIQIIDSGCRGGRSLICCFVALLNIYSALSISVDCLCASWLLATLVCKRFWKKNHVWRPSRPLPQAAGKFGASSGTFCFRCVPDCAFFMSFRSGEGTIYCGLGWMQTQTYIKSSTTQFVLFFARKILCDMLRYNIIYFLLNNVFI